MSPSTPTATMPIDTRLLIPCKDLKEVEYLLNKQARWRQIAAGMDDPVYTLTDQEQRALRAISIPELPAETVRLLEHLHKQIEPVWNTDVNTDLGFPAKRSGVLLAAISKRLLKAFTPDEQKLHGSPVRFLVEVTIDDDRSSHYLLTESGRRVFGVYLGKAGFTA